MAKIIKIVNCDSCPYGPHQAGLCKEVVPFQEGIPEKCPLEDAPEPIKSMDEYHRKMKGIEMFPDDGFRVGVGCYPAPPEEG